MLSVIAARSRSRSPGRIRSWLPDDRAERGGRADPREGDAGHPDDRRGARRVDARAVGRGEGVTATAAG